MSQFLMTGLLSSSFGLNHFIKQRLSGMGFGAVVKGMVLFIYGSTGFLVSTYRVCHNERSRPEILKAPITSGIACDRLDLGNVSLVEAVENASTRVVTAQLGFQRSYQNWPTMKYAKLTLI